MISSQKILAVLSQAQNARTAGNKPITLFRNSEEWVMRVNMYLFN